MLTPTAARLRSIEGCRTSHRNENDSLLIEDHTPLTGFGFKRGMAWFAGISNTPDEGFSFHFKDAFVCFSHL